VKASVVIGDAIGEKPVQPGDREVVFELNLPKGRHRFSALFTTAEGTVYGAYYAYVKLLP
jgi:hypothetical protein